MKNYGGITLKDGFRISIQAGERHYCVPRNDTGPWVEVELGFPAWPDKLIEAFAEDPNNQSETIYGYVPISVVQALIIKHGGISEGNLPKFHWTIEQSAKLAKLLTEMEIKNV